MSAQSATDAAPAAQTVQDDKFGRKVCTNRDSVPSVVSVACCVSGHNVEMVLVV